MVKPDVTVKPRARPNLRPSLSPPEASEFITLLHADLVSEKKEKRLDPGTDESPQGNLSDQEFCIWTGQTRASFNKIVPYSHETTALA